MNWSAAFAAEVPDGVVTVTVTAPGARGGATAVRSVGLVTVTLEAAAVPKATAAVGVNPVPVTVTWVRPPQVGPAGGETAATVGGAAAVTTGTGTRRRMSCLRPGGKRPPVADRRAPSGRVERGGGAGCAEPRGDLFGVVAQRRRRAGVPDR